jgi:hypothetical protein
VKAHHWHIPEFPVVRLHPVRGRPLKSGITMMVRFIDFMNERRPLAGPDAPDAMTGRTIGLKFPFARLQFNRHRSAR